MRGQVKSNTWFQTKGRCKPLSRLMELLLLFTSTASIVLHSQFSCTGFTTIASFQSMLWWLFAIYIRGPQCHCWGHSPVVCHTDLHGSLQFPVHMWLQLLQGVWYTAHLLLTSLSSGFTSGYVLRWRWGGSPEGQGSSLTFHSSLAHLPVSTSL